MNSVLIVVHAVTAVLAAAAGAVSLVRPRAVAIYPALLVVSLLALAGSVAVRARDLDPVLAAVDTALLVLFVAVVVTAERARRVPAHSRARSGRFTGGVGFGLIALTDGFAVIAVLRAGAPVWAQVAVGVGIAAVGHRTLSALVRRRAGRGAVPTGRTAGRPAAG